MSNYVIAADYSLAPYQAECVDKLISGIESGKQRQVMMGITGSGKTYIMANVIERLKSPAVIIAPNKALAAQLYQEFKAYFPSNAVEYFVSYYDYYQPEAYVASRDLYIEKDALVNDELERMRLAATRALFERQDVVIVASVSCIYGLGSPEDYGGMLLFLKLGDVIDRDTILERLIEIGYERNDYDFYRGTFRVRGDVIEVYMAESTRAVRIELFGDEIEAIAEIDPLLGTKLDLVSKVGFYPASHYVTPPSKHKETIAMIREELRESLAALKQDNRLLEYQRLEQRTLYDIEMIQETGTCKGIENYSRIIQRREAGSPPTTLLDYLPSTATIFIDESHVAISQLQAMYRGDFSRKSNLVEHGFRLPSAIDNRPLKFEEFEKTPLNTIFVSATPGPYELAKCNGETIELIIRPTGLLDPVIEVRPVEGQVDDLLNEIKIRSAKNERVLVTTLTKRMAEDLSQYYQDLGVRIRYLHSDIDTIERVEILRDLRLGEFDVLVGINLLREGLDLPEVSLVAIFDADKEGFLRSYRSLMQTCGRASRNPNGMSIFYADRITQSMREVIDETQRRRDIQAEYNRQNNITPQMLNKKISDAMHTEESKSAKPLPIKPEKEIAQQIKKLEKDMLAAAKKLDFEHAADLRDAIAGLRKYELGIGGDLSD